MVSGHAIALASSRAFFASKHALISGMPAPSVGAMMKIDRSGKSTTSRSATNPSHGITATKSTNRTRASGDATASRDGASSARAGTSAVPILVIAQIPAPNMSQRTIGAKWKYQAMPPRSLLANGVRIR